VTDTESRSTIDAFLEGLSPAVVEEIGWRGGQMRLEVSVYLTRREPPDDLTTSGRCLVIADGSILVMTNPGGRHIMPGGRRKDAESPLAAAIREVREETGLRVEEPEQVAVLIYRHVTPRPIIYPYPYPMFANVVYLARVPHPIPIEVNDTYELEATFTPLPEVGTTIPLHQRALLNAIQQRN